MTLLFLATSGEPEASTFMGLERENAKRAKSQHLSGPRSDGATHKMVWLSRGGPPISFHLSKKTA